MKPGLLLVRLLLYTVVMFLIMVVYIGQQHADAKTILRESAKKTARFVGWTVVLLVLMQVCFWLFIDP